MLSECFQTLTKFVTLLVTCTIRLLIIVSPVLANVHNFRGFRAFFSFQAGAAFGRNSTDPITAANRTSSSSRMTILWFGFCHAFWLIILF